MKLRMTPESRWTGNIHTLADKLLSPKDVSILSDGQIEIKLKLGPIHTTGNFNGKLTLSLAELYQVLGAIEDQKLTLISKAAAKDGN